MVHVLASIGFSLVALATLSFIVLMLAGSRDAIVRALRLDDTKTVRIPHREILVRSAGRWQSVQTATAQTPQPQRAAA